jgi:hypothetical protein
MWSFKILTHMRDGIKVMRLIFYLPKFLFISNINAVPFRIVALGSYTPMLTVYPLLVAALEVFSMSVTISLRKSTLIDLTDHIIP